MIGYYDFVVQMTNDYDRYNGPEEMHLIEVSSLKVHLPKLGVLPINKTPHYKYANGVAQPYIDWLFDNDLPYEFLLTQFHHLMNDQSRFLEGQYKDNYIVHDDDFVILNGVYIATRLFQLGVKYVPALRKIT